MHAKRLDGTPCLLAMKTREAQHSDNLILPLTAEYSFWKEYEILRSVLASTGAAYIIAASQSQQHGLAGLGPEDGLTAGCRTTVPHLQTKGTSEECHDRPGGAFIPRLDDLYKLQSFLPANELSSEIRTFCNLTQLDVCIPLPTGSPAGALRQLECLHAALSYICLLVPTTQHQYDTLHSQYPCLTKNKNPKLFDNVMVLIFKIHGSLGSPDIFLHSGILTRDPS